MIVNWLSPNLFLLSPTALAYVPSFLLQIVFIGYLLSLREKPEPIWLLIEWLAALTLMIGSQILAYSLYTPFSTYINWMGGMVPGLVAVLCFVQFAYRYPRFVFEREARLALIIGSLLIVGLVGLMLYEIAVTPGVVLYSFQQFTYDMVSEHSRQPLNSPNVFDALHPLGYVWALVVWLRVAFRLSAPDTRSHGDDAEPRRPAHLQSVARAFWRPPHRAMQTVRAYILFMLFVPSLTLILRVETLWGWVPPGTFAASFLIALFIFGLIYINSSPMPSTVMVKVVGISLVTLLSLLGLLSRFAMDLRQTATAQQRHSEVAQLQASLAAGSLPPPPAAVSYILQYPAGDGLFSTRHELLFNNEGLRAQLFVADDARLQRGLAAGSMVAERAAFHQFAGLEPHSLAGIVSSQPPTALRLFRGVFFEPPNHYLRFLFSVDDALYEVGYSHVDYRQLLHQTALPLLALMVGATVAILLVFPLFFRTSIINPLNNVLAGVERIDRGDLSTPVPVLVEDELGYLARAFNRMSASLQALTTGLRHEISVRRQAEATARASAHRFRQLFDNAPLAIFDVEFTAALFRILSANRQAQRIYGWSAAEFEELPPERLVAPAARPTLRRMMEQVRAGEIVTIETTNQRRDGTPFPVRISATPDQLGGANRMIIIAQDITTEMRRRSEAEAIAEDRRRIAREMHDSLAQTLVGLRFRTRLWQRMLKSDPAQLHPELDEMRDVLESSIAEVRRSIFALRPLNLDELGFFPALRRFTEDFGVQYRLPVHLQIVGREERLPTYLELNLFRVVQESLNNVAKHARASAVWLRVDLSGPAELVVSICDDGRGFEPATMAERVQQGHLGLKQMRERVEGTGGVLLIYSQPGQGSRLEITMPLLPTAARKETQREFNPATHSHSADYRR